MAVNIDRQLSNAIFDKCFRGLTFDVSLRKHFVYIPNVDESTFLGLADFAAGRGIRLMSGDLNSFLKRIEDMERCLKQHYNFTLSDNEIQTGEVIRVFLNNMKTYVDILKAKSQDYIVVRVRGNSIPKTQYIHVSPNFHWQNGEILTFGQNNTPQIIKDLEFLTPCTEHRYLDLWLEPNLAEYEVTDNLWPLYNLTRETINDCMMQKSFFDVAYDYLHKGLSVFSLYKVIRSIENYWYEADL